MDIVTLSPLHSLDQNCLPGADFIPVGEKDKKITAFFPTEAKRNLGNNFEWRNRVSA